MIFTFSLKNLTPNEAETSTGNIFIQSDLHKVPKPFLILIIKTYPSSEDAVDNILFTASRAWADKLKAISVFVFLVVRHGCIASKHGISLVIMLAHCMTVTGRIKSYESIVNT